MSERSGSALRALLFLSLICVGGASANTNAVKDTTAAKVCAIVDRMRAAAEAATDMIEDTTTTSERLVEWAFSSGGVAELRHLTTLAGNNEEMNATQEKGAGARVDESTHFVGLGGLKAIAGRAAEVTKRAAKARTLLTSYADRLSDMIEILANYQSKNAVQYCIAGSDTDATPGGGAYKQGCPEKDTSADAKTLLAENKVTVDRQKKDLKETLSIASFGVTSSGVADGSGTCNLLRKKSSNEGGFTGALTEANTFTWMKTMKITDTSGDNNAITWVTTEIGKAADLFTEAWTAYAGPQGYQQTCKGSHMCARTPSDEEETRLQQHRRRTAAALSQRTATRSEQVGATTNAQGHNAGAAGETKAQAQLSKERTASTAQPELQGQARRSGADKAGQERRTAHASILVGTALACAARDKE
ncbi:hypothetical protein ERJ75_001141200 [Trypanosoma vivax]|nr:hypothetical protein ERJ75_001141200 [Trypanosoma vivax]